MKVGQNIVAVMYLMIGAVVFGGSLWLMGPLWRINELLSVLWFFVAIIGSGFAMRGIGNALNSVLIDGAKLWRER